MLGRKGGEKLRVNELRVKNLFQIFSYILLRINVFIKEKSRPFYLEFDRRDLFSDHYVLEKSSKIIGGGRIRHIKDVSIIDRMAINQRYRGLGYGARLFEKLLKITKKRKKTKVVKLTAYVEVRRLYEKFGFQCVGNIISILGRDNIKMQLNLKRQ